MDFIVENYIFILIALVSGGMLLWPAISGGGAGGKALNPTEATRLINDRNPHVVDLRSSDEFGTGHLINAKSIPTGELDKRVGELKNRPVFLYCASGARSNRAVSQLKKAGIDEAFSLTGGIAAWQQAGLPVVK